MIVEPEAHTSNVITVVVIAQDMRALTRPEMKM